MNSDLMPMIKPYNKKILMNNLECGMQFVVIFFCLLHSFVSQTEKEANTNTNQNNKSSVHYCNNRYFVAVSKHSK